MGRDKKNPKPLDVSAFNTLVKTASELSGGTNSSCMRRCTSPSRSRMGAQRVTISLDIELDEDSPSATLHATDAAGDVLADVRVAPSFRLTRASASAWADKGFDPAAVRAHQG
jgi:hypothetical protein